MPFSRMLQYLLHSCLVIALISIGWATDFDEAVSAYEAENYEEAAKIFIELSQMGHTDAINNLGTLYQIGLGVEKDYSKAAHYYQLAAERGHEDAAFNLASFYRLGIGVKKNMIQAYAWSIVAARHGDSESIALRDQIERSLKKEEKQQGIALAKSYLSDLIDVELALAWLVPQEVKAPAIPPELKKYFQPFATNTAPTTNNTTPMLAATTPTVTDATVNVPTGFSLIAPKDSKTSSTTNNIIPPPGFSVILPKSTTNSTVQDKFPTDIPAGFSVIAPKNHPDSTTPQTTSVTPEAPVSPIKLNNKTLPAMPMRMSQGETLYRPIELPNNIKTQNATLIRPRRQIPAITEPLVPLQIDEAFLPTLQSLANALQVPLWHLVAALKTYNPTAFEPQPPLRLIDPDYQLHIPSRSEILKTPINAASLPISDNKDD